MSSFAVPTPFAKKLQAMSPQDQPLQMSASKHLHERTLSHYVTVYKRRHAHAAEMRFEDAARRTEMHYYWQGFQQEWKNLQESAGCLLAKSTSVKSEAASKKSKARSKKLHARMQADLESLGAKMQAVDKLMVELGTRNRQIQNAEQALDNVTRALITAVHKGNLANEGLHYDEDDLSETSLAPTSEFGSEASTAADPGMAPQLVNFYSAVSNYRIMRERLLDLGLELQEQWERRLLLQEQDQPSDQTDEEFTAAWREMFVGPEEDFHRAKTMLQESRKSCIEVGVDVPPLEDLQISNAEGDDQQHSLVGVESPSAAMDSDMNATADHPLATSAMTTSQQTPFGEEILVDQESATPSISGLDQQLDDSSPATPLAVNDKAVERITQWVDNVDLEVVDHTSSLRGGPSSAITASTGDRPSRSHFREFSHPTSPPTSTSRRRQRATSLPHAPTFEAS